jgi:hypothetical protein
MNQKPHFLLTVPTPTWARFREALLAARVDREEVIGFFFCTRHKVSRHLWRLLPKVWVVPTPDCYDRQSAGGLALRQDFHQHLVDAYVEKGLDSVHVHTHPGVGRPDFSMIDDHHEAEYARFLGRFSSRPRLISGVFDERVEHGRFRVWPFDTGGAPATVAFTTDYFGKDGAQKGGRRASNDRFDRQLVFGSGVQERLGRLSVGLIGCGGIGAVFAEQLSRLGVANWVLVDPDHLEESNLNRLPCATLTMVQQGWSKVRYVKHLIKQAWPVGSQVVALAEPVEMSSAECPLAACDLLVVATDNHRSRMIAQEIALRYVRPLLSLGTSLQVDEARNLRRILCRVTAPPLAGGWCLMCGDVIDTTLAALEAAPAAVSSMVGKAGYLDGVAAPAVYWINSCAASLGVYAIHGALSGFVDLHAGIDWVIDFERNKWLPVPHEEHHTCFHCSPEGIWASGCRRSAAERTPSPDYYSELEPIVFPSLATPGE